MHRECWWGLSQLIVAAWDQHFAWYDTSCPTRLHCMTVPSYLSQGWTFKDILSMILIVPHKHHGESSLQDLPFLAVFHDSSFSKRSKSLCPFRDFVTSVLPTSLSDTSNSYRHQVVEMGSCLSCFWPQLEPLSVQNLPCNHHASGLSRNNCKWCLRMQIWLRHFSCSIFDLKF